MPPISTGVPPAGPPAAGTAFARPLPAAASFCQAILDGLPANLCVLDQEGVIVAVNRAWREFAADNGLDPATVSEGASYLAVCDRATGPWAEGTAAFARGLRAVLAGEQPHHTLEYPCHSPGRSRWFLGTATRLVAADRTYALVLHSDITERHGAETVSRDSREQLRALAARLQQVREDERAAIAREVHDVFAQEVTRLKCDLIWLQRQLVGAGSAAAGTLLVDRAGEMIAAIDALHDGVQRLATGLRPALLDTFGLGAAVEWQVREFARQSGLVCTCEVPPEEPPIPPAAATAAFRILQESLSNVRRHAQARRVEVRLHSTGTALLLRVADDGRGIAPPELVDGRSLGIAGMRERALTLGGRFEVRPQPAGGTVVELQFPLKTSASSEPSDPSGAAPRP